MPTEKELLALCLRWIEDAPDEAFDRAMLIAAIKAKLEREPRPTRHAFKIQVGGYTLTPGAMPGRIWISAANGEGGDFHLHELAEVIDKFYQEKF
jgi:hypothetical protein